MTYTVIGGPVSSTDTTTTTSSKDIGELMLVPVNFAHPDFIDTGKPVTLAQYPELFQMLSYDRTYLKDDTVPTISYENTATTATAVCVIPFDDRLVLILKNGMVMHTEDLNTFSHVGDLPILNPNLDATYCWGTLTWLNSCTNGSRILIYSDKVAAYSDDMGVTWSPCQDQVLLDFISNGITTKHMIYTGEYWVSYNAKKQSLIRSVDGLVWSELFVSSNATSTSMHMLYGNGSNIFMKCSAIAKVFYSTDSGETWSEGTLPYTPGSWAEHVYAMGCWYAMNYTSSTHQAYKSVDGITWTTSGSGITGNSASCMYMKYVAGKLIAHATGLSVNSKYYTSVDGTTWTTVSFSNLSDYGYTILYKDKLVIICTSNGTNYPGKIVVNDPAVSATAITPSNGDGYNKMLLPSYVSAVACNPVGSVIVGLHVNPNLASATTNNYIYSKDYGSTWNVGFFDSSQRWSKILHDGSRFIVMGPTNLYATSVDGENWVEVAAPSGTAFGMCWSNNKMMAFLSNTTGNYGMTKFSNEDKWYKTNPIYGTPASGPYGDGDYQAFVMNNSLYSSTNGWSTYSTKALGMSFYNGSLFYTNGSVCGIISAPSNAAQFVYSMDNFQTISTSTLPAPASTTTSWKACFWTGTNFILISSNPSVSLTSPDGITWAAASLTGIPTTILSAAQLPNGDIIIFGTDGNAYRTSNLATKVVNLVSSSISNTKYVVKAK